MKKAALIGRGYWGKILIPYIQSKFELISITGRNDSNIKEIAKNVDVFFIATPIETHYRIVKKCIKQGKHVFCEKPLTDSYKKAKNLDLLSKKYGIKLYTDYTEMTALSRIEMVKMKDRIGRLLKISALTTQYGKFTNKDVFWQLSCHQLSVLSLFTNLETLNFSLKNVKFLNKIAVSGTIVFSGSANGTLFVDINQKNKSKVFVLHGDKGVLVYDRKDLYPIKVYKDGVLRIRRKFNEDHNLCHSVDRFDKIIKGEVESNNTVSIEITRIIENLLKFKREVVL